VDVPHTNALVFGFMTSPVGSLSSVTFTDEVTVKPERLPLPARRERNSRADWPELRDVRLKVEIFQLGAKIVSLETRRPHRDAPNAPPGKISRLSQPHASVRWPFMGFSRAKIVSLLVWTHLYTVAHCTFWFPPPCRAPCKPHCR